MNRFQIIALSAAAVLLILVFIIIAAVSSSRKKRRMEEEEEDRREAQFQERNKPGAINTATSSKTINYETIIDMTKIITNNDAPTVEKIRLLTRNYSRFVATHQEWCNSAAKKINSLDKNILIMHFFVCWLSGYSVGGDREKNPSGKFCCYTTGKEKPAAIIKEFEEIDRCLNYGFQLSSIPISNINNAAGLIPVLSENLSGKRYTMLSMETDENGCYLFVIPTKDHGRVIQDASKLDFKMYRNLVL